MIPMYLSTYSPRAGLHHEVTGNSSWPNWLRMCPAEYSERLLFFRSY